MDVFPVTQIREGRIVVYNEFQGYSSKRGKNPLSQKNLRREVYKGIMSKGAKKALSTRMEAWASALTEGRLKSLKTYDGNQMKMVMVTLTLPALQAHEDTIVKRLMLSRFLIVAKRKWNVDRYIWRAEKQLNGNIHFHIIADRYIPKDDLRGVWNAILSDHGYIDQFEAKHGHRSPPSTDISMIRNIKMAGIYIQKYMTKQSDSQVVKGAIWGCSDNLKGLKSPTFHIDNKMGDFLSAMSHNQNNRLVKKDNCTIIFGQILQLMKAQYPEIFWQWRNEVEDIWRDSFPLKQRNSSEISLLTQAQGQKVSRSGSRAHSIQLTLPWY